MAASSACFDRAAARTGRRARPDRPGARRPAARVSLPWRRESINRAARIQFGMICGPSVREIYAAHAGKLT
jgi:hypothetical protein